MPRNSSGIYSPPVGTYGVSGTAISSSAYDTFINDLSTEISNSLNVQGTAPMLAPLNMGTFKIINAATPVAATDVAIKSYVDSSVPTGMIAAFALDLGGLNGWIECQGYSLSTTTYANLFGVIGYTYGGSGANFNIPDFRGCFLRGFDGSRGLDFQGNRAAGAYQASYLINHFHSVVDPTHFHGISDPSHLHGAVTGGHSHSINEGGGHAHSVPGIGLTPGVNLAAGSGFTQGNTVGTTANVTGLTINAVGNLGVTVFNAYTGINSTLYSGTGVAVGNVSTGGVNFAANETTVQNYPVLWCIKY